jgi:nucleotide-binding universal stress UspA family protein
MIDSVLLGSGRPILIVPFFREGAIKFDRILVCWDGSQNAARAVADGMPFLTRAKQVEVVRVAINGSGDDGMSTLDIGHHLSRHGGAVEVSKIAAHNEKVSVRIRSHAALQSVDLIVMGGYGHSRLREWVLGSETREMLESTAVPILMSH